MKTHVFRHDDSSGYCAVDLDKTKEWLSVKWKGFMTAQDGERGAEESLRLLQLTHIPFLLNANSQFTSPWFDSLEWLERVWAPQAVRLGLRYVAHVMQSDVNTELAAATDRNPFVGRFDLQIFSSVAEAQHWLRECQKAA